MRSVLYNWRTPNHTKTREIIQFVLPLRLEDELIGTLQFDVEESKLNDRRQLILKAFSGHLAIAISRLRSIRQTFDLTHVTMRHSRFIMAETVSAMALHSVHHKLKDINKQLHEDLIRRDIKENRFLLDSAERLAKDSGWPRNRSLIIF